MANRVKLTQEKKQTFLAHLRETGNVTLSARAVAIATMTLYDARKADPAFETAWKTAIEEAIDVLEEEARRRAFTGTSRKKFHLGKPVLDPLTRKQYVEQEYSDLLLIFLLKAHRPAKYRERYELSGKLGIALEQLVADPAASPGGTA